MPLFLCLYDSIIYLMTEGTNVFQGNPVNSHLECIVSGRLFVKCMVGNLCIISYFILKILIVIPEYTNMETIHRVQKGIICLEENPDTQEEKKKDE